MLNVLFYCVLSKAFWGFWSLLGVLFCIILSHILQYYEFSGNKKVTSAGQTSDSSAFSQTPQSRTPTQLQDWSVFPPISHLHTFFYISSFLKFVCRVLHFPTFFRKSFPLCCHGLCYLSTHGKYSHLNFLIRVRIPQKLCYCIASFFPLLFN